MHERPAENEGERNQHADPVPAPDDWRTWRRVGDYLIPPPGTTPEQCIASMWPHACEKYGINPDNPLPMRKDVVRKFWRHELRYDEEQTGRTADNREMK